MNKHCIKSWLTKIITALIMLSIVLGASPAVAFAQSETTTHIVAWGETLSTIALRYGVTVEAIIETNSLDGPDRIYAGQSLVIPGAQVSSPAAQTTSGQHTVQSGENLYRIGLKYGLTTDELAAANGLSDTSQVYAGQVLTIPEPGSVTANSQPAASPTTAQNAAAHVIQRGETLANISQQYGVSINDIVSANNVLNPSAIYAGQTLSIPGAASSGTNAGYTPAQAATTYTVQPGDTLFSIATRYGISVWALEQTNNISNPSLLQAGNILTIPSGNALTQPAATQSPSTSTGQAIVVDVSDQRAYIYENGALKWTFIISTGMAGTPTARGNFEIQNKIPNAYAATWDLQMPWWLGIYWAGPLQNGFHALPIMSNGVRLWASVLGQPASYGCIILSEADAQTLYNWAQIGTPVTIRD